MTAVAPGWQIKDCGPDMNPGLRAEWDGRQKVLCTHPLDQQTGCMLTRTITVPSGKKTRLRLIVGHDPQGDFELIVRANGKQLLRKPVEPHHVYRGALAQAGCRSRPRWPGAKSHWNW